MIQKTDLTAQKRGKGGSLVKLAPAFIAAQQQRDAAQVAALGLKPEDVAAVNRYDADTAFVVVDLFERVTFNDPTKVAVKVPGSGLAFGVKLVDIIAVVA